MEVVEAESREEFTVNITVKLGRLFYIEIYIEYVCCGTCILCITSISVLNEVYLELGCGKGERSKSNGCLLGTDHVLSPWAGRV